MKKQLIIASLAMCTTPLLMGAYGWHPTAAMNAAALEVSQVSKNATTKIAKTQTALVTAIQDSTSLINEAVRANIKQEAVSATLIADADFKARQVKMAAEDAVDMSKKVIEVQLNYGPHTGQGYKSCVVYRDTKQVAQAVETASRETADFAKVTDNAPGRIVKSGAEAVKSRNAEHARYFCTDEEVELGMNGCKAKGVLPGGDSDAGILFESAKKGTPEAAAKAAVRQNILGSPIEAIPRGAGNTALGQAYLNSVNRKAALASFPAHSLAYLQSMSEIRDDLKDAEGKSVSPNELIHNTVTRYYGGPQSIDWRKSLNQQRPRGQMVELAKMEGLATWIAYQKRMSNQRIGGNLAALVITAAIPMEDKLNDQYSRLRGLTAGTDAGQ